MKTYKELKEELENLKKELENTRRDIRESIVAILIQSKDPLSAREIADYIEGVTAREVAALINNSTSCPPLYNETAPFGLILKTAKKTERKIYVNVDNPSDIRIFTDRVYSYYVEKK